MAKSVKIRLDHFSTAQSCGKWNASLIEDFMGDSEFNRLANELNEKAIGFHFQNEAPVADFGGNILGIEIEFRYKMSIQFSMSFLSPRYFVSPAQFTLELDRTDRESGRIEYFCGISDFDGGICMERDRDCVFPTEASGWAFSRALRFRNHSKRRLGRWIEDR